MEKAILFPTEFSNQAPNIFHYVLELAKRFDAKIIALNAIKKPDTKIVVKEDRTKKAKLAMDKLLAFTKKHRGEIYQHIEITHLVIDDFPCPAILQVAQTENVNLIVMGMSAKSSLLGELFGSVAFEVLNKSDCPVLAIPTNWEYNWFHKILYATEFSFRDIGVLNQLQNMATIFNGVIDCLHVVEEGKSESNALVNMQLLAEIYQDEKMEHFLVEKGTLVEEINKYLANENAGIVVMLAKKKRLLERLFGIRRTKEVAQKVKIPLLVFKEDAYDNQENGRAYNDFL